MTELQQSLSTAPAPLAGPPSPEITIPQYRLPAVLAVWAAAALPMAALSWVVAPAAAAAMSGPHALTRALLVCLTAGMAWQLVLVAVLVRREQGTLAWRVVRDALWLRSPRSPRTGRVGGRLWLVLLPCVLLFGAEELIPTVPLPAGRDFATFLESSSGQAFFHGAWGWFALVVAMGLFNTVLGEELFFRGFLLPRMQGAFGRRDWLANGVLFALYHLHVPWAIPSALVDSLCLAWPSRRFRSAWIGIAVHSTQTVFISLAVLAVVR